MDLQKDLKNINLNIDAATLYILYARYKNFLLPIAIIILSIIFFFAMVTPQIQNVLNLKEQQAEEEAKLATLKNNYSILSGMDQITADSNYQLLTSALPASKDFAGIINAITSNSVSAGVSVGDFQFNVGDISNSQAEITSLPSIQIALNVTGDAHSVVNFIENLYKSFPLSEVTSIQQSGNGATIKVQFYYKAFPVGEISDETSIIPLSKSDTDLIQNLSTWQDVSEVPLVSTQQSIPEASASSQTESTNATESGQSTSPF